MVSTERPNPGTSRLAYHHLEAAVRHLDLALHYFGHLTSLGRDSTEEARAHAANAMLMADGYRKAEG